MRAASQSLVPGHSPWRRAGVVWPVPFSGWRWAFSSPACPARPGPSPPVRRCCAAGWKPASRCRRTAVVAGSRAPVPGPIVRSASVTCCCAMSCRPGSSPRATSTTAASSKGRREPVRQPAGHAPSRRWRCSSRPTMCISKPTGNVTAPRPAGSIGRLPRSRDRRGLSWTACATARRRATRCSAATRPGPVPVRVPVRVPVPVVDPVRVPAADPGVYAPR